MTENLLAIILIFGILMAGTAALVGKSGKNLSGTL